ECREQYDQPIYMDLDQLSKCHLDSYMKMEEIQERETGEETMTACRDGPHLPPTPTTQHTNDHNLCASPACSPYSTMVPSNLMNLWPSSSSLSPSSKIVPSNSNTPSKVSNCVNISVNTRSVSSRASSVSSCTGSLSPFPGSPHLSPSSTWGYSSGSTRPAAYSLFSRRHNI
ncbi:hypothetical protein Hamer_G016149, partial [Homarus americanus]